MDRLPQLHRHPLGVTPKLDESLLSFADRLARRIGMENGFTLLRRAGWTAPTNRPQPEALGALSEMSGVPVQALLDLSFGYWSSTAGSYRGHRFPTAIFSGYLAARKVCPSCLSEDPYHRAIWDLSFISACPVHQIQFIHGCPACGDVLHWRSNELGECACGCRLAHAPTTAVKPSDLRATAAVHGLLGDARFADEAAAVRAMPPFEDLANRSIIEFLYRLGLGLTSCRRKLFSLEQPEDGGAFSHLALQAALDAATEWPGGFPRALDQTCELWGPSAANIKERLAMKVESWLMSLPPEAGREIKTAVTAYRQS